MNAKASFPAISKHDQDSSTAMRFVWNLLVFGIKAAQIMAQNPKAMLVYLR